MENVVEDFEKWDGELQEFKAELRVLVQPIAHGTTSENLEGILKHGLGSEFPANAIARSISLANLSKPDGLLLACAFSHISNNDLEIRNKKDVVTRYVAVNPRIGEEHLREKFAEYMRCKDPSRHPVMLIYEGGKTEFEQINPLAPSEIMLSKPLEEAPKIILVAAKRIPETKELLAQLKVEAKIFALEVLELDAI